VTPDDVTALSIRRMVAADVPQALTIQAASYPAFLREDAAAFASRIAMAASCCFAATRGPTLVAYLLAHGWAAAAPPPIGAVLDVDSPADILFLHDLAVAPAGRGTGVGRRLVAAAFDAAARLGLTRAELIAVEGAQGYWAGLGFVPGNPPPPLARKVAEYGASACWMERTIAPP